MMIVNSQVSKFFALVVVGTVHREDVLAACEAHVETTTSFI